MRRLVFLFIGILSWAVCFGQRSHQKKADSLLQLIKETHSKIEQSLEYGQLALIYSGIDSVAAFESASHSKELAIAQRDTFAMAQSDFTYGGLYLDYGQPKRAEHFYTKARDQLERLMVKDTSKAHLTLWVRAVFDIGVSLAHQGRTEEELTLIQELIPHAEKIGLDAILGRINSNLGIQFFNLEQYEKAYGYFKKSGIYYRKIGDYPALVYDRLIFAACLQEMDSLSGMKSILEETHGFLKKMPSAPEWFLYHLVKGEYHAAQENYGLAIASFDRSKEVLKAQKLSNKYDQLYLCYYQVYQKMGLLNEAEHYLQLYLTNSKRKNEVLRVLDIYPSLAELEAQRGDFKKAYQYLGEYRNLNDSISALGLMERINQLEIQYQSEKKEREILELQNQNNEAEISLQKNTAQRRLLWFIALILLCLAVIGYMAYRAQKRKTQLEQEQHRQAMQLLEHEQESKIFAAINKGQEQERERVASDLHDGLAGRLSATSIQLKQLQQCKNVKGELLQSIEGATYNVDNSLKELRNIARHLMPETLFKYGLKSAVEDYCSSVQGHQQHIKFILQFYDENKPLENNTLLTIYRIIQELITNAVKHAKAKEVLVQCTIYENAVNITVEDDGIGFAPKMNKESSGLGLKSVHARVALLNGSIEIDTEPNEGTHANIEIPL